jgi:mannose-6-phosphate isomerase-like protein (cupin superfamily)
MNGFIRNLTQASLSNTDFRIVLYTAKYSQLVLMSLKPGEEIGFETHMLDQLFKVEAGFGHVIIQGVTTEVSEGSGIIVPAGINHNILNTGQVDLKLCTFCSPPIYLDGITHHTRQDAISKHEYFNGITTD